MKRNPFGIETKVGAATGTGGLVSLVFGLAAFYHWFTPPPTYLTGLIVAAVSGLAAWIAPHTPRPLLGAVDVAALNEPAPPAQNLTFGTAGTSRPDPQNGTTP